jgi:hypothetical protein
MAMRHDQALAETAAGTLEQLAFLFAYPSEGGLEASADDAVGCRVCFEGARAGELWGAFARSLLPELAGNMLGLEAIETVAEQQLDALREVMNVICGNLLPQISGPSAVFEIKRPEIVPAAEMADRALGPGPLLRAAGAADLSLDEGWCRFLLLTAGEEP